MFSGITANNAVQLYKDFGAAHPNAKLYGPDGVAETGVHRAKSTAASRCAGHRTSRCRRDAAPNEYPPERPEVLQGVQEKYGVKNPDPYAIYGYEAMSLALDAIKRAGDKGNCRDNVIKAIFATKDRQTVLGTYSIDKNGDTTLTDYGGYTDQERKADVRQDDQGPEAG